VITPFGTGSCSDFIRRELNQSIKIQNDELIRRKEGEEDTKTKGAGAAAAVSLLDVTLSLVPDDH